MPKRERHGVEGLRGGLGIEQLVRVCFGNMGLRRGRGTVTESRIRKSGLLGALVDFPNTKKAPSWEEG